MPVDYNSTLNLPKTEFPMRANLPKREAEILEKWEAERKYYKIAEKNKKAGLPKYILHDGPPYANGDIHLGTSLNKILKDIIVKYKTMSGFYSPYIPGWDCHGLPIELKAMKMLNSKKTSANSTTELRKYCREFALSCLDGQKKQFKRLGVWADFEKPYITVAPGYEARQIEIFGEMYKKGYVYKGLKPVCWCASCRTALAEAEIEYEDDDCKSVYVKFPVKDTQENRGIISKLGVDITKVFALIWTTTPWTLPGNLAISVNPSFEYSVLKTDSGEFLIVAKELAENVISDCKESGELELLPQSITGKELEFLETNHPFLGRISPIICGNHVTLDGGTGLVHTAPGFGADDYEVCNSYKNNTKLAERLQIIVPVDQNGKLTEEAGIAVGEKTDAANETILACLESEKLLFSTKKINHSYPHCWRCHKPIIYRATPQWFVSVNKFSQTALKNIGETKWIPEWGKGRIENMVANRSDWCISRQRRWGVPIPVLYCSQCGEVVVNDQSIKQISEIFREKSSDAWYDEENDILVQIDLECPKCGKNHFTKEQDIFDVWFDSGCSHAAVVGQRKELIDTENGEENVTADLYLEGADQYRGWFQSSLLTSSAVYAKSPYKTVLTHGWVVDGQGKQMHKSLGNSILPEKVIDKYGADILRLWVVSSDYHADIRVSDGILKQLSEVYRKIRNTARFMLSNLYDFDPNTDSLPLSELSELDKYAIHIFNGLIVSVNSAYESTDFCRAFKAINEFCVTDMSNLYLDVIKDGLYCDKSDGKERRSIQTALYIILSGFTRLIAPILAFTSEEIWEYIPKLKTDDVNGVLFNRFPTKAELGDILDIAAKYEYIRELREDVFAASELKRAEKIIGKQLDAYVEIYSDDEKTLEKLKLYEKDLTLFFGSKVVLKKGSGEYKGKMENISMTITNAGERGLRKCERCWTYTEKEELCMRCFNTVQ